MHYLWSSVENCKGYIGVIYRSPSQNTAEFEEFLSNFEDILNTTASSSSLFTIILGDFNTGSSFCWKNDKTIVEGRLDALTSLHGFHQLIWEPTRLLPTSTSCIDSNNDSNIPYCQRVIWQMLRFLQKKDINNVIKALDSCKAHGYDDISIRMLEICDSVIAKPLIIQFKNCISQGIFPDNWKKSNICPIHKKVDKQIANNYRPVSLLPVCGKIFERLIFNSLYQFLEERNLLSIHQYGFRCNDSCINQLLFIVHTLYKAFDAYPTLDARGVFLDMFIAFEKVLHEELIYKLKSMGVSDSLLKLIQSFLTNRFQKGLLNGQTSEWLPV